MADHQSSPSRWRRAWQHFWRWWPYPLAVALSMSFSLWLHIVSISEYIRATGGSDPLQTHGAFAVALVYLSNEPLVVVANLLWPAIIGVIFYLLVVIRPTERVGRWCRIVWGVGFIPLQYVLIVLLVQPSQVQPSSIDSNQEQSTVFSIPSEANPAEPAAYLKVRLAAEAAPGVLTVNEVLESCADGVALLVDVSDADMEPVLQLGAELKPPCRMRYDQHGR